MFATTIYWLFQIINTLSSLEMFLAPRKFHESLVKEPEKVYPQIGFSPQAVEMVRNVIRGQGAALLSISVFLYVTGPSSPFSFLLIGIASALTLLSHIGTMRHHMRSPVVMTAIGSLKSIYPLLAINAFFAVATIVIYLRAP